MGKKKAAVTLHDVANKTGVSVSTVSRVLAGKEYISPRTRQKVMATVAEMNYSPNAMARGLKSGQSNMIALVIPSIHNLMFPVLTRGVEDTARKNGYMVILCNTDEDTDAEKGYITKLRNSWVDGMIFATMLPDSHYIRELRQSGFPVVLTSRAYDKTIDAVVIDNVSASYDATCYLIGKGYRRIAFAMGPDFQLYEDRFQGYCNALKENGIPFDERLVMHETDGVNSFAGLIRKMIEEQGKPDAVFASTDNRAIVIMRTLYDMGFRIPDDIAVMGFDNVDFSSLVEPPLSTVSQPLYDIGATATRRLIHQIRAVRNTGVLDPPVVEQLETHLLIRQST
ncbi:LacI family DNA-binding transcriptional regulator [Parasphaerochaeta coccoides]|uniref:Transcriptional regulator, LacI family n=1 Tax=Parasphaerochaeta coccoides (strain ATCC BAA-1237 / DSM 17374 / SPN1) TaxID=760011 RepID=F4GJN0_PARC1|nr:LacI family DNA-binding transcriptional regulator [Parasphaerochaeta coccoides]AEC02777.1 transcriptional regulator, LacI family [Parasphaerochaeta coccoides DSM 17374]